MLGIVLTCRRAAFRAGSPSDPGL